MIALSSLLLSVIEPRRKAPSWGARPRMPECHLPFGGPLRSAARAGCPNLNRQTGERPIKKTNPPHKNLPPLAAAETYGGPPPPRDGRLVSVDCHPDIYTAAVYQGTTAHDARKLASRENLNLTQFLEWAGKEFTHKDLFVMEAGGNSFEIHRRLVGLGLRAVVLESGYVG